MKPPKTKAFTVIELVMVIVILGIIAIVAITSFPDMQEMRLTHAANKIKSDIRFAQRLAMQLQRRVGILFDATSDNYSIHVEEPYKSNNWDAKAKNPLTLQDFDVQLNSGEFKGVDITVVYFNNFNFALVFDINGEPYAIRPSLPIVEARLSDPAGLILNTNKKYIIVKQGTGRVNVQNTAP